MSPYRDTRPYVGFMPTTPHSAAGCRTDPPVSVPSAMGANPVATATADPPLEPPGIRDVSHGLRVGPKAECSVEEPIANSSQFVLPMTTAPAACSRSTAVAEYGGVQSPRIREPAVARTPRTQIVSLMAIGTPW